MTEVIFQPQGIVPTGEQRAIQLERRKHVVIEANAGAAKTTTLALRLAQALARGAQPEHIVALTYTEAAVTALREALARIGVEAAVRRKLRIDTFDAFCAERLLRMEGPGVAQHGQPEQLKPLVLQALARVLANADEHHPDEFAIEGTGEGSVEGLLADFAQLKGTLQLSIEAADRSLTPTLAAELNHSYLTLRTFWAFEHLRRGGHPDRPVFRAPNDATYDLARLLLSDEGLVDAIHPLALGLHLVLVDEMHDTNRAMFTVLQHLLRANPAAFVGVGDRDQVIHALAGADADFMGRGFDEGIAQAHRFTLSASYRFGPSLARHVGQLARKACASGRTPDTEVLALPMDNAKAAHRHITQAIATRAALSAKAPLSQVAILLRQAHQSVALENHLLDHGVAYRTAGFDTYLMRPEVLFVRGLLAHARQGFADIEPLATRQRVLQAMLLFAGSHVSQDVGEALDADPQALAERQRLQQQAIEEVAAQPQLAPHFVDNQVLRNAPTRTRHLIEDALDVIERDNTEHLLARFVQALMPQQLAARVMVRAADIDQVSANIEGLVQSAATYDNVDSFFRAMNAREVRQHAMRGSDCVLLSSIEASKGLEFEHVILPGLNKGEFALGGNTTDNRNLLYVGMTRARNRLTVLFDAARPSKYLVDAGLI